LDFTDDHEDQDSSAEGTFSNDVSAPSADIDKNDDIAKGVTSKIYDDSSEDEESQNETLTSSSNSDSDSVSVSDSDYDESMKQIHNELTRKEMARLKALEFAPPIKIFNDLKIFDDDFFSDEPIDSNHPINAQSEGITVQA
jgi:hypothetical protein